MTNDFIVIDTGAVHKRVPNKRDAMGARRLIDRVLPLAAKSDTVGRYDYVIVTRNVVPDSDIWLMRAYTVAGVNYKTWQDWLIYEQTHNQFGCQKCNSDPQQYQNNRCSYYS